MGVYKFKFGLKVPSSDWYWKYGLSYDQAVEKLHSMGVDFIMCGNEYLPSVDTAVPGGVPRELQDKMAEFDERTFRETLREAGIAYIGSARFGFNEELLAKHQNFAIDQYGKRHEKIDWYVGACPTCDAYVEDCLKPVEAAMDGLDMDGLFLGFMRYPGFWELWLPGTDGEKWPEYCFCERCVAKFMDYAGVDVPIGADVNPGSWIRLNAHEEWVKFKTSVIHDIIARYRAVLKKYNPQGKIILNTVPFDNNNYGDYGRSIFGQDVELLSDVVDIFEVMGYHQILGRPYEWLDDVCKYFKGKTSKTVICTVQGQALYIDGIHKGKGRLEKISSREFENALGTVHRSAANGAVVFTWSDFLYKEFVEGDLSFLEVLYKMKRS